MAHAKGSKDHQLPQAYDGLAKSHPLSVVHNLVQRSSLRRQCKQQKNTIPGEVNAHVVGKKEECELYPQMHRTE